MYFWPRVWAAGPPLISPHSWACSHSPRGAERTGIWSASLCRVTALRSSTPGWPSLWLRGDPGPSRVQASARTVLEQELGAGGGSFPENGARRTREPTKPPPSLCTTGQAEVGFPLRRGDRRGRLLSAGRRLHDLAPVSSRALLESGSSGHGGGQSETDVPTSAARLASCLPRNLGLAPSRKETLGLSGLRGRLRDEGRRTRTSKPFSAIKKESRDPEDFGSARRQALGEIREA